MAQTKGEIIEHPARGNALAARPEPTPIQPFTFQEIERIAEAISRSGMFGSSDFASVLTLCMVAHAEGQHPATVFRDYNIIKGKPSKSADAMLRDFHRAGGRVQWRELSDQRAEATFSHAQGGTITIDWDIKRARAAGLLDRKNRDGSPSMWEKFPRAMLRSRVVSEGVKTVCPGATSGLYTPEEVYDIIADDQPSQQRGGGRKDDQRRGNGGKDRGREPDAAERRANAEEFARRHLKRIGQIRSIDELDATIAKYRGKVRALARLQSDADHPDDTSAADLYRNIQQAYESRAHELNGYEADGGDPAEPAGPSMEESPVEYFEEALREVRDAKDLSRLETRWLKISAAQSDEVADLVEEAFARRRRSLRERSNAAR